MPAHPSPSRSGTGLASTPLNELPPSLLPRPAAERFHSSHGWLDSWHSFSFAGHDHPAWRGFGPLRVINDDRIAAGGGFGMHPHRDMEIITVMVEGVLRHRDSLGHSEALQAGEVQWMSAGSGIVHSEFNGGEEACRLLQIWIEPAQAGLPPRYGQKPFPRSEDWTLLVDPQGREGALSIERSVRLWRAQPQAGSRVDLPGDGDAPGWIQMVSGAVTAELTHGSERHSLPLQQGDGLGLAAGVRGALTALEPGADLLVFELG